MEERIKADAPNIPDEVIRLWLLGFAEHRGWPPAENGDWDLSVAGEPISFWNDAVWEKVNLDLSTLPYSRGYFDSMRGLRDAYVNNVDNQYSRDLGEDGKRRYGRCLKYIAANRVFPQPPILVLTELGEFDVLDGNHRFIAYISTERAYEDFIRATPEAQAAFLESIGSETFQLPHVIQEVWVCRPGWENSGRATLRTHLRQNGLDI